ncbi:MAG TPA: lysophospholipid acyltransferase family protein, partial [Polyangiaceae bacterium LLY-WYZ-15_(1-7)]|nr:lysophospholipid acyltransferase family protein [Polyangiaceae bacterium LLY-WYZ-15_(1-7)]
MPRPLRIFLTGLSFLIFFGGSLLLGIVVAPILFLLSLGSRERGRTRVTRLIGFGYGTFIFWLRLIGLLDYQPIALPEELKGRPYVLIANHPSLIDVIFLLHWFRKSGLTCVVKGSWYRNFFFGPLLRSTHYIPTAGGIPGESDDPLEPAAFERMVDHVAAGHPLIIFPEGTRSLARRLHRFKRGAFEIARRNQVPIVEVFIRVDRPMLMKGVPFWHVPEDKARYEFEIVGVIDTATDPRSTKAMRRDVQGEYERRFAAWVEQRERPSLPARAGAPAPKAAPV